MKKIILTLIFLTVSVIAAEHKVVFSLTTSKEDVLEEQLIKQIALLNKHYSKQGDSLKVAVVIYGGAYNFFLKSADKSLKSKLKNLYEKYNVSFDMCGMGMKKRGITNSMIYNFVNPEFNKNVALIKWQNKGYAYIEIE
jgi:intracellular sulfur oxidation DsrE/DsrF family protein